MLQTRPLLSVAIAFMIGIAAQVTWAVNIWVSVVLALIGVGMVCVHRKTAVIGVFIAAAGLGALRYGEAIVRPAGDVSRWAPAKIVQVEGYVQGDPQQRMGRVTFPLDVVAITNLGQTRHATGTVRVTVAIPSDGGAPLVHDGDHLVLSGALDIPTGATNPGALDWRAYLARRGIYCEMYVRNAAQIGVVAGGRPNLFRSAAWTCRAALLSSLQRCFAKGDAAVLAGVLLGLRTDLPPALLAAFVATGTVHILATAGLHVAIVYKMVMEGLLRLMVPKKAAALATISVIWLYDLMAGGRMAVTRAAIMATIYLMAIVVERIPDALNSLGAAALIILVAEPAQFAEMGFQTSFAAVLVIASLMPIWEKLWHDTLAKGNGKPYSWLGRKSVDLIGLTLFAQIGAAPIIAQSFNMVSVLGIFANIIVVPTLAYLIPAGFLVALTGIVSTQTAQILAHWLVAPVIHFIVATVTLFANCPGATVQVTASSPVATALFYSAIVVAYTVFEPRILKSGSAVEAMNA